MTNLLARVFLLLVMSLAAAPGAFAQSAPAPAAQPAQSAPKAPTAVDPKSDAGERLDRAKAQHDQAVAALQRDTLDDAQLQALRANLEPAATLAQAVVDELAPRADALRARVDQLGPKPDEKSAPESPAVASERAEQQKLLNDAEEQLKRARLLVLQIQQTGASIVARRRALFVKDLFQHTRSIFSPALWTAVAEEAPREVRAIGYVVSDFVENARGKFAGWRGWSFVGMIALIGLINFPLAGIVRRILSREPTVEEPSQLAKAVAAAWVAIVIAILPLATIVALFALAEGFDVVTNRLSPVRGALIEGVARIAITAGLARGLLASSRPNWRLLDVSDETASALTRLATSVAALVSFARLLDAINEAIGASLPVTAATQGVSAFVIAAVIAFSLAALHFGEDENDERTGGRRFLPLLRFLALAVSCVVMLAAVFGFVRFAAFLADQIVWVAAVATMLRILAPLISESLAAGFQPTTRIGRFLTTSLGLSRDGVNQLGVLLSGLSRLVVYVFAALLVVAPWGVGSDDFQTGVRRAFFGFNVGEIEISPRSLIVALLLFGALYGATRAAQNWLADKFLPATRMDAGLRNAIRTSVGYVGLMLAVFLALSHVGLGFEKLTIVAGALSVGIGFGLQSIVSNFVSGLIVLWEGAIRVGDLVVVGTDQGFVRRINVRSTEIETFERATMVVPNSNLITGVVKNWVRSDRVGRVTVSVTLQTGVDPERVREIMIRAAKGHEQVARIPAPNVLFVAMEPSGLKFDLVCFVDDVETSGRVKSDLHFEIFRQFRENAVAIATPSQVIVSVDQLPEGVTVSRAG